MNTADTNTTGDTTGALRRRLVAIAIVGALALSFAAAFAALKQETDLAGDGIFAWIGDYLTQVSDAIESE